MKVLSKEKWLEAMQDNNIVSKNIAADYGQYVSSVRSGEWEKERIHGRHDVDSSSTVVESMGMSLEGRIAYKFIQLEKSAFRRGLEFNLTLSEVRKLVTRKTCFYTKVQLSSGDSSNDKTKRTVDRLNPQKGYVMGNVVACSFFANQLKRYQVMPLYW